jgi:hypothetical protein
MDQAGKVPTSVQNQLTTSGQLLTCSKSHEKTRSTQRACIPFPDVLHLPGPAYVGNPRFATCYFDTGQRFDS